MTLALLTSDWISIAGTAVALAGFAVTIIQVRRVGSAVKRQQRQTAGAMILSRTSDLEQIEAAMRSAHTRPAIRKGVLEWRRHAAELQSVLDASGRDAPDLAEPLELSLGLVDLALDELQDDSIAPQDAVHPMLREMSRVCTASRGLGAVMMLEENR